MDEVEFQQAYAKLRILIDHARAQDDCVNVCNALLVIAALIDGLNQRVTEMQLMEEDDE